MSITVKTHKLLWGASGNVCAKCKRIIVEDATLTDDHSIVGEEAHIASKKTDGPRYADDFPHEKRDSFENLMILCATCHSIVDEQVNEYTAIKLRELKKEHENNVRAALNPVDLNKQRDDLIYADYVDYWSNAVSLDNWAAWSSWVLSGDSPSIHKPLDTAFEELRTWLLSRVWPGRYQSLESSFINFRLVAQDFQLTLHKHLEVPSATEMILRTHKFYKSSKWLPDEEFDGRLDEFCFHVDLVQDLMFELTRAANYVCDNIRQHLIPTFRLKEGRIFVERGPSYDFKIHTIVPQYHGAQRIAKPYPGLQLFLTERQYRDYTIGIGESPTKGYRFDR